MALFTYSGFITLAEAQAVVAAYAEHPASQRWMRQLCDLSAVTGVEHNFLEFLRMQAKFVEALMPIGRDLLVMFYAPTKGGQDLAHMARKSWAGLNSVIVLIQQTEAEALALLGQRETSIAELLAHDD